MFAFFCVHGMVQVNCHFIEIELDEASIHHLTVDQAMEKIRKYEAILAPIGISHRNRLTKSLFEMYVKKETQ